MEHFRRALKRAHQVIHQDLDVAREMIGEFLPKINSAALGALVKTRRDAGSGIA